MIFCVFIEKHWDTFVQNITYFSADCGLLFQDFLKLSKRVDTLEEIERERVNFVNFSQGESTDNKPAAQSVNGKVKLRRNQNFKDSFERIL